MALQEGWAHQRVFSKVCKAESWKFGLVVVLAMAVQNVIGLAFAPDSAEVFGAFRTNIGGLRRGMIVVCLVVCGSE